ncbi:hypothetical protein [Rhizobium leguminosarum]|uniref:hypothetical protein n=1 Tax=Rhizobium leguminosarum TaxID=384 RepID=UPI001C9827F3|nr:hypothetical protein [Rhizobium leguminosarum]MBY5750829.1 hypothetical protein [Rhizobium leguminosarum]
MAGAPTVVDIWPVLVPVVIGGTFGLLGGLIGPLVTQYLGERRARKERRSQLFEAMISGTYEYGEWLDTFRRALVFNEAVEPGPSPLNKVHSIALLHFRELLRPVMRMNMDGIRYQEWMINAARKRNDGDTDGFDSGFPEATGGWINAQAAFLDLAAKYWTDRKGAV